MAKGKKERVAEHMASGMSRIEAEMLVSREDAKAEMRALKAKAARQEKKINAKIGELIKRQHPETWDSYRNEAMVALGLLERVEGDETPQTEASGTADTASQTDPQQPAEQAANTHQSNGPGPQQEHQYYDPNS